jgi:thiol-disulfide isomerase/thioredoxin
MKYFITTLCLLFAFASHAQYVLKGTVKDGNGKAPIRADVHIGHFGEKLEKAESYPCAADGSFSITLPKAGCYLLRLSAVNHEEVSSSLIIGKEDKEIDINAELKPNAYQSEFGKIRIIGDWNKFAFSGTDTMTLSGKVYTYSRTASGDTLSYQLLGVAGGHSVNGTQADYFVYDGGGDYRSVLKTKSGGNVTITFDPAKVKYSNSDGLPRINFPNNGFLQKAYVLESGAASMREAAMVVPQGGGPITMDPKKYQDMLNYLAHEFHKEKKGGDTRSIEFAAVMLAKQYHPSFPFDSSLADEILQAVPAASSMWAISPDAAIEMTGLVSKEFGATYKDDLATKNPERTVRATALVEELAFEYSNKNEKRTRELYTLLKGNYGDLSQISYALTEFNPDAVLQVGKMIPNFEVVALDGTTKISNRSLLGKYYMVDFWATWCGPCVREMPAIHEAYKKFKGKKGFDILSISMDADQGQIAPFRKKWAMPWLHAFIPGVFDAELAKRFEVAGIPKPVLVDPSGKIVAMQEELRGEDLEKTLGKFLGQSN